MTSIEETKTLAPWTETLPSEWRATRLDAVADVLFSNVDKHTIEGEVPVRLCNYVDVYKNERITGGLDFMEASAEPREIKKFQIQRGDVLATKDSEEADDIAIPALVAEDLPGVLCGYHLALIRPRFSTVSGPFLAWLHSSKSFRAQYEANAIGVTRFGLSQYAFRAARVPLPPLPEQQRIAAYLDASCAAIDAAVAAKRRQIETLDALRKSTITRALTLGLKPGIRTRPSGHDWLGEIPQHWSPLCLKRLLRESLTYGLNEAAELEDRDLPRYLRITDFDDDGKLRDDTFRSLPWEVAREALLQPGDVLFARSGATVGKTFIFRDYSGKACFAGYLIRARTLPWKLDAQFLYLFTKTLAYDAWKNLIFTQATIQNISAAKYNYLMIPVPPLPEQQAIIEHVQEKDGEFGKLMAQIEFQIATLTAYRKSLIHECVTGQRRVKEADVAQAATGREAK
jgi:type I restriction enzyme S subunit